MNKTAKGRIGEYEAAEFLKNHGYKIVETNSVICGTEVDIIAKDGKTLVFCEVKTRADAGYGSPAEAVNAYKIGRYITAAKAYTVKKRLSSIDLRFDVIEIDGGEVRHIPNAFDSNDARYPKNRR